MTESERRRKYRYNRVLIETERILDPQFDDAVVFLSGAQIEMLRNVTQYLNRLDTYVSEQFLGYYLAPTVEDYDSILEIVADLEESLMGNPNTLFGYLDVVNDINYTSGSGAGNVTRCSASVPAGEIWRVEAVTARNTDTSNSKVMFVADMTGGDQLMLEVDNPDADKLTVWDGTLTLEAGAKICVTYYGCTLGDELRTTVRGYKMAVPE